jgi:RNA polymerase sigma factor (sigma-70 family)
MPLFRDNPTLLVPFRDGQAEALTMVYRHYVRPLDEYLRGLARATKAPDLAHASAIADLLQEVFVRAFAPRARLAYDGLREYGPYLSTIARNCFVDALRKRQKELAFSLDDEAALEEVPPPDASQVYDPAILAVLQRYLSQLSAELKGIYEQRFVQGVSQDAACELLGISRRSLRTGEDHLRTGLRRALQLAGLLHEVQGPVRRGATGTSESGLRLHVERR